jgi:hypothetical protein
MGRAWLPIAVWIALMFGAFFGPSLGFERDDGRVRRTIDVALAYYVVAAAGMLQIPAVSWRLGARPRWLRPTWSLAWLAYLVHVVVAFNDVHRWSHAAAFAHTQERSGVGAGIFVSHFFTAAWGIDVSWWWINPNSYFRRPAWLGWCLHGFLAFIAFNGTVIYESGAIRWVGSAVAIILATLLVRRVVLDKSKLAPHIE